MLLRGSVERPMVVVAPSQHDFGLVHTEACKEAVLYVSNPTEVSAEWQVRHVRVPAPPKASLAVNLGPTGGGAAASSRAAEDDPDVFSFSEHKGTQSGPSLPLSAAGSCLPRDVNRLASPTFGQAQSATQVGWSGESYEIDLAASLQRRNDENFRAPRPVVVTFRPKGDRAYQSRFRFTVSNGEPFDVILSGKGTYAENTRANPDPKVGPRMYSGF